MNSQKFIYANKQHPGCFVGFFALLTTTMTNMEQIVNDVKAELPETKILIGGVSVSEEFKEKIYADFYSPDPQWVVDYLNTK